MRSCPSRSVAAALAASIAAAAGPVHAEPRELRHETRIDAFVTGASAVYLIASELEKPRIVPGCRWCDRDANGKDTLNGLDSSAREHVRWSRTALADTASYVTGFALAPLCAFGLDAVASAHDGAERGFGLDALLIGEATLLALDLDQTVKLIAARERPFVHVLSPDEKRRTADPSDNDVSFFSGHTTAAFALATSSGTIASLRDYRLAPLVWAVGLPLAASTGYLRIAADRHYFIDVVVGAVVGAGVGIGVPLLFHGRQSEGPASSVAAPLVRPTMGFGGAF